MKISYPKFLAVFISLIMAACSNSEIDLTGDLGQVVPVQGSGQYTDIIPQELKTWRKSEELFVVNVHIP